MTSQPGPRCLNTLRCVLRRLEEPRPGTWSATFLSRSEPAPFTLSVRASAAQLLLPFVGQSLDVEMMYVRGDHQEIAGGELRGFETMWEGDPLKLWDTWVRESGIGAYWAQVACIECELGRFCAKHPEANPEEG